MIVFFGGGGRVGFVGRYLGECNRQHAAPLIQLSSHIKIQHIASALVSEYECRKSCLLVHVKV